MGEGIRATVRNEEGLSDELLLGLPDEASGERFRGMWHQSPVMECTLPELVGKTFMCPY